MSDYKSARLKDGSLYEGNQLYAGGGTQRSCGRCGKHRAPGGFKMLRPWGLVCPDCQTKGKP